MLELQRENFRCHSIYFILLQEWDDGRDQYVCHFAREDGNLCTS